MAGKKGDKAYRRIIDEAERQGWRVKGTRDGYQLFAPDGVHIVTIHLTESDDHAFRNTLSRLRLYGFVWDENRLRGRVG